MKKYVFMLIMAFTLLLPFQVNADLAPLRMESYANEATVGSTVTYLIRGIVMENGVTNLNGKMIYDKNQLEYQDINILPSGRIEGEIITPDLEILKNQTGHIEYKIDNSEFELSGKYDILVTFKVKAVPSEGDLTVKFYPADNGGEYNEIYVPVLKNAPVAEENETEDKEENDQIIENETEIEDETTNETEEKVPTEQPKCEETTKCDNKCTVNTILLIGLIVSGIVNIILIVLVATRKKKTTQEVIQTPENLNK